MTRHRLPDQRVTVRSTKSTLATVLMLLAWAWIGLANPGNAQEPPEEKSIPAESEAPKACEPINDVTDSSAFENVEGWSWMISPVAVQQDGSSPQMESGNGMVLLVEEGKESKLMAVIAHPGVRPMNGFYSSRPIAFDRDGKRYALRPRVGRGTAVPGKTGGVVMERYDLSPKVLPADRVSHVGVEGLTIQGLRLRAAKAVRAAEERGLAVLPFPAVGEKYIFELRDLEGDVIDSRTLKGKVVVLDLWATWCFPCMEKMPKLKALHEKWHPAGLEVVGINFDESSQACADAVEKDGLRWKHSMAPANEELRDLWLEAIGGGALPRLLVIDRNGVLRADCKPDELEQHVDALLKTGEARSD